MKSFVAFRSSDLLSGPAIFSTTKDAGFYIEESDITPAVYKEFESFEEAVSYISSYLNKDREWLHWFVALVSTVNHINM